MGGGATIEGIPTDIYEAEATGTHYLNISNYSWSGTYVIKVYSNTPAAPVLSHESVPSGTDSPLTLTITGPANSQIYYLNSYGETYTPTLYQEPLIINRMPISFHILS
jgi:hypothetical protein